MEKPVNIRVPGSQFITHGFEPILDASYLNQVTYCKMSFQELSKDTNAFASTFDDDVTCSICNKYLDIKYAEDED